jgi:hypothetical protein
MQEERTRASLPGWLDGLYNPDETRAADRFAMERRGILELELAEKARAELAATYVVRKGVENEEPVLTGTVPETTFPGEKVRIRGKNLAFEIADADPVKPEAVLFGGRPADPLSYSSGSVEARVPESLEAGTVSIRVMRSDGVFTAEEPEFRVES